MTDVPAAGFIVWTDAMSVGRSSLDERHKMIIDCLNRLHPLLGIADRDAEVHRVIEDLEDFVLVHFSVLVHQLCSEVPCCPISVFHRVSFRNGERERGKCFLQSV